MRTQEHSFRTMIEYVYEGEWDTVLSNERFHRRGEYADEGSI